MYKNGKYAFTTTDAKKTVRKENVQNIRFQTFKKNLCTSTRNSKKTV